MKNIYLILSACLLPHYFSYFWGCSENSDPTRKASWLILSMCQILSVAKGVDQCEATGNRGVLGLGKLSLGLSFPIYKMTVVLKFDYR